MSQTPSEPGTEPVVTASPQNPVTPAAREEPRRSRLGAVAAWVGIVAGVVFVVAVIFFSGFIIGAHSGGHHGGGRPGGHDRDFAIFHRGPPPGFPMGPRGDFQGPRSGGPGGAENPRFQPPQQPQSPEPPTTTAPARP
ncbi:MULTISPECIES: hypothetical protein [unclassified Mycobacterium]|uniref:hypothetical protein n=1 Tax=unclassified Mycobacterium TaxID=2642494 RepID=UPI001E3180C6|nr:MULTISPECIES: hypothetical protein [unclassified Mycobacterium]